MRSMPYALAATVTSVVIVIFAILSKIPNYNAAPLFLIPMVWIFVLVRRRIELKLSHYILIALAFLLHMSGAFGFYINSPAYISFDIYVHFYFAFAAAFVVKRLV